MNPLQVSAHLQATDRLPGVCRMKKRSRYLSAIQSLFDMAALR